MSYKYGKSSSYDSGGGGGGGGVCYKFQGTGFCPYGNSCTYRHIVKNKSAIITTPSKTSQVAATNRSGPAPLGMKRPRDGKKSIVVSTEIILCKTDNPDKGNEEKTEQPTTVKKLASIFCKPPTSSKPKMKDEPNDTKYPEIYLNLFYRKHDINLLIKDGLVVWEFGYNVKVIEAIKVYIKGRAWNPNMGGRKGCWTAPIESLPDCIDLYEHMGRTASDELKDRALQITKAYGDSSASDAIKLSIDIYLNNNNSVGSFDATFLYDTKIVSAFKMLPPTQRSYDPTSKVWTVDLFALPSLIDILVPLGYNATKRLSTISNLTKFVYGLFYDDQDADATIKNSLTATSEEINDEHDEVIDLTDNADDNGSRSNNKMNELSKFAAGNFDKSNKLEKVLKSLVRLVGQKNDSNSPTIDASSCGDFKRPRLNDGFDYDDDSGNDYYINGGYDDDVMNDYYINGGYDDDVRDELDSYMQNYRTCDRHSRDDSSIRKKSSQSLSSECDCGHPHKMSAGRHTCRYFGTFKCAGCHNGWTSAYCWKGEKQACRSCNEESLPVRKDQLDGRPPVMESTSGRGHDSARCGRCRSLGYNCSL
ncbi:zinc finger protein [Fragilariopsis cylindrus CCMP1102]|uniref:Zinc finger protein n=1 Tax=Fragilariopsis cylindrus CCMP1102 TaxID=635003 RepID=A0A1E7F3J0_9STRA|nr:zinc finger protein [Fragilariopsis cylindrus CCMP1102]|eukprot:OEU12742.1 zinc finger protein [Fragilariopsis cylindrus CCMP1102]